MSAYPKFQDKSAYIEATSERLTETAKYDEVLIFKPNLRVYCLATILERRRKKLTLKSTLLMVKKVLVTIPK